MKKQTLDELSLDFPTINSDVLDCIKGGGGYGGESWENYYMGQVGANGANSPYGSPFATYNSNTGQYGIWSQTPNRDDAGVTATFNPIVYNSSRGAYGYWTEQQDANGWGVTDTWHNLSGGGNVPPSWIDYANGGGSNYGGSSNGSGYVGGDTTGINLNGQHADAYQYTPFQAIQVMLSSLGLAASHTDAARAILNLESKGIFLTNKAFGILDPIMNVKEMIDAGQMNWEDSAQAVAGVALLFCEATPIGIGISIVGGAALFGWELYETLRDGNGG